VARIAASHLGHVGMLARQGHELLHVRHDVLARQQKVKLGQAQRIALELLAEKGFQGGDPVGRREKEKEARHGGPSQAGRR
jgi:hypothetical protein